MKRTSSLCLLLVLFLLAACGNLTVQTSPSPQATPSDRGTFQEYALPQANSGLMRPTIDQRGRLWFGEMGHNLLTSFDPQTQTFQHITPPRGKAGIMGIAVASDNTIWVA